MKKRGDAIAGHLPYKNLFFYQWYGTLKGFPQKL
jgi:hypothetical protein